MSLSNSVGMYADVKLVLDAAVAKGGGEYKLVSKSAATKWRQRAYQLRKLMSKDGETPYDRLVLTLHSDDPTIVCILTRRPEGEFIGVDGESVLLEASHEQKAETNLRRQSDALMEDILKGGKGKP